VPRLVEFSKVLNPEFWGRVTSSQSLGELRALCGLEAFQERLRAVATATAPEAVREVYSSIGASGALSQFLLPEHASKPDVVQSFCGFLGIYTTLQNLCAADADREFPTELLDAVLIDSDSLLKNVRYYHAAAGDASAPRAEKMTVLIMPRAVEGRGVVEQAVVLWHNPPEFSIVPTPLAITDGAVAGGAAEPAATGPVAGGAAASVVPTATRAAPPPIAGPARPAAQSATGQRPPTAARTATARNAGKDNKSCAVM
jgi:hypothetical protein